jgi:hypothetical protein
MTRLEFEKKINKHKIDDIYFKNVRSGGLPMNTVILFVPQQEAWIVERFGKYQRVLQPICIIIFDKFSILIPNSQIAKNVSEQIVTFLK